MEAKLSDGCPHSSPNQVSLKSNQRIRLPILKAARTGSRRKPVPGTGTPVATGAPGTIGPSNLVHSQSESASQAQASESKRHKRAIRYASSLLISKLHT